MLSFCFAQSHCKALHHKMVHCKTTQSRQNRPSPLTAHLQWRHQKTKMEEWSYRLLHKKCISNQSTHGLTYQKALHQKYKPYTIIMFPLQKVRHHNRNRSFQNASFSIYHSALPIRLPHPNTDSHLHLSLIHLCQSKSPSTE